MDCGDDGKSMTQKIYGEQFTVTQESSVCINQCRPMDTEKKFHARLSGYS